MERSATVAPLSTDFEGYNLVVDDTDAILLVGGHVTTLPISREQSANSKGKSVVGTTPRTRWKKRAHAGVSHVSPVQDVG